MYSCYIKRILDIIICIICLPLFAILLIIFGLMIKIEDYGPVFYKGERIGKDSKLYKMYKFRSMNVKATVIFNKDGNTYNSKHDSRVTKIGKFMRETSIDETPQIINVLKGDMSIVGPRASLAGELESFQQDELDKMRVKPGITGYTQAYYRNRLSSREKRLKDAWYARNESFWLDMKIFFRTIITVVKREGLYTNDNTKLEAAKNQGLSS